MRKGQISLDFLLAILFALIILIGLSAVSEQAVAMQKSIAVRQQLHSIGVRISTTLSTATVLGDAESGTIVAGITPPLLQVPGEEKLQKCRIEANESELSLSYTIANVKTGYEETINEKIPFAKPRGIVLVPALSSTEPGSCGSTITARVV